MRLAYAIVFVSDMTRAVSFCRDIIGLALRFESPSWTEFATDGPTLAPHLTPANASAGDGQLKEAAGSCRPGLSVANLDGFRQWMVTNAFSVSEARAR